MSCSVLHLSCHCGFETLLLVVQLRPQQFHLYIVTTVTERTEIILANSSKKSMLVTRPSTLSSHE